MVLSSDKAKLYIDRALYGYVVLVVLYQLLTLAFPVAFISSLLHLNIISQGLAVVGLLLFVVDAITTRRFLGKRYESCLILVLVVLVISSLLLPRLGTFGNGQEPSIIANAKSIIWQIDQMLVIFPYCASLSRDRFKKLARTLYWVISVVYIPCLLASFWQYAFSIGYDAVYGTSTGTRQGFQGGRLFGLMMGVFSCGLMSLILAFASAFFAAKEDTKKKRSLYIAFAFIYGLYSVLTGTRSVAIAFMVAVFVMLLFLFLRMRETKKASSLVASVLGAAVFAWCGFYLYMGIGLVMAEIPAHNSRVAAEKAAEAEDSGVSEMCALYSPEQETTDAVYPIIAVYLNGELMLSYVGGSNAPYNEESLSYFQGMENVEIVRMDESGEEEIELVVKRLDVGESAEVSNGRIAIWSDYMKVILSSPKNILVGLSPGYYMPTIYAQYLFDDLYIVDSIRENHPNMLANGLIYDVHNAYLSALVQSGVVGCLFLLAFLLRLASDAMRTCVRSQKMNHGLWMSISIVALLMAAVFFDSDLFYRTTCSSVLFWVLCGFIAGEVRRMSSDKDGLKRAI